MSNDEVVKALKARIEEGAQPTQDPAGEVELSQDDLDSVAGGTGTLKECTTEPTLCKGTCCIPYVGGCCGEGEGETLVT